MNQSEIVNIIVGVTRGKRNVLGSDIGVVIKAEVQRQNLELDMRSQYGGLKAFIDSQCADKVRWTGKKGGDDVYEDADLPVTSDSAFSTISAQTRHASQNAKKSFFHAFSNPKSADDLYVNLQDGTLNFTLSEHSQKIEKLTTDEYKEMARSFLPKIPVEFREPFVKVVEFPDFWPHWSTLLKSNKSKGLVDEWKRFRSQQILTCFLQRIEQVGLDNRHHQAALLNFKENRSSHAGESHRVDALAEALSIRDLVHSALDQLTDEDLRRIWLPVGVLLNELDHTKK